ncbi:phylloplanin-like [Prunus yedoensis var. nudiflora]|uniref:Phylloplanin-like n=1 Tax=Prunus yedoensis var. nudiflora TaxID=2094558 RepID=A0A314UE03_PRUYE|nr:phylloplanin-like [Prunus yedoensis var. nudiflora]
MAPFKTILFVCVLIAAVSSVSKAQDLGLGGVISIQGTVYCTVNGTVGAADATVVLKCGATNTKIASVTTTRAGVFSILLNLLHFNVSSILSNCSVVVTTPLAACNATLSPTQALTSPLQLLKTTVIDNLPIISVGALGFHVTS